MAASDSEALDARALAQTEGIIPALNRRMQWRKSKRAPGMKKSEVVIVNVSKVK
jgi:tryptophan synthase beta subunit